MSAILYWLAGQIGRRRGTLICRDMDGVATTWDKRELRIRTWLMTAVMPGLPWGHLRRMERLMKSRMIRPRDAKGDE